MKIFGGNMRRLHFAIVFVLLSTLFATTAFGFLQSLKPLQDVRFYRTPEDKHIPILNLIQQAETSIDLTIFNLTDYDIINALIAAQKRGVIVRVLIEQKTAKRNTGANVVKRLQAGGVSVYLSSPLFSITHMKAFLVDKKIAFVSTMNFIRNHHLMRDYAITTTEPSVIEEMIQVFEADLINSQSQTGTTPQLSEPRLVWSPINSTDKILKLLDSAKVSIDLVVENLSDGRVIQSLGQAVKRGVLVRVLMSTCVYGETPFFNYPYQKRLQEAGVDVQVNGVLYQHAKTILVDGRTMFLGSENFSANSLRKAREVGLIFQDRTSSESFLRTFEGDWAQSTDLAPQQPTTCPFTFDLALSPQEIL